MWTSVCVFSTYGMEWLHFLPRFFRACPLSVLTTVLSQQLLTAFVVTGLEQPHVQWLCLPHSRRCPPPALLVSIPAHSPPHGLADVVGSRQVHPTVHRARSPCRFHKQFKLLGRRSGRSTRPQKFVKVQSSALILLPARISVIWIFRILPI